MHRQLILMRHAKSDWSQPGLHDKERPLNARGKDAAPRMAHWLREWLHAEDRRVARILSSTSVRTRETLERMREAWGLSNDLPSDFPGDGSVEWVDALYLAEPRVIWDAIRSAFHSHADEESLLVLGHNPGMEILMSALAGSDLDVPTAAIAIFESRHEGEIGDLVPEIESGNWRLLAFQTPRSLSP
ncbi:phosphohistidine phosphatase [Pirellula sp. SH-Sr6A]|nr:phosphohistidine phosphatase [Pirellula sp. SH-Sr6A]